MRPILLIPLLVVLGLGCARDASVSESQCAAGDWETIGYRDGALGHRPSRLLAHQDACIPHGVTPDRDAYQLGWRRGIGAFCHPDHGYALGLEGEGHDNVCPDPHRDAFLSAWNAGRRVYVAQARVEEIERAIALKSQRLNGIDEEIAATASAQLDPTLLPAQRVQLAARAKALYDEKLRLRAEIPPLEQELGERTRELEALGRSIASTAG